MEDEEEFMSPVPPTATARKLNSEQMSDYYVPKGKPQRPSCWSRVKMGFMLGMCVGMAGGVIFGSFSAWRMGLRGREMFGTIGKVMIQSGGTFGTFMAIGSGIRC